MSNNTYVLLCYVIILLKTVGALLLALFTTVSRGQKNRDPEARLPAFEPWLS